MILFGTKAWAKQTLKAAGINQIPVAKRPTRLANATTTALYQAIFSHNLV